VGHIQRAGVDALQCGSFMLVGHGLGAMLVALRQPALVLRLVLCAPAQAMPDWVPPDCRRCRRWLMRPARAGPCTTACARSRTHQVLLEERTPWLQCN
jgi:pimeloyl-ACP methyl ester carboxylesterase